MGGADDSAPRAGCVASRAGSIEIMNPTGYKLLGYLVWHGGRWYVRRRYGGIARRVTAGTLVVVLIGGAAVAQRRGWIGEGS